MTTTTHEVGARGSEIAAEVWARGNRALLNEIPTAITLTGSRASTSYGDTVASDFAGVLAKDGHLVVTGGAYGIDTAVIRGTLAAGGAPVIVLPCGIDKIYPSSHAALFETVVTKGGLLVSLSDVGTLPSRERFIARAAWMGSQTAATIVVEAATRASSLMAAKAAELAHGAYGAVPGPISSAASSGTHALIADGAAIIHDPASLRSFARFALAAADRN